MADIRAFDIDIETKQTPRGVSLKRVERSDGKFLKALITMVADENGLLPGEVGYTDPVNVATNTVTIVPLGTLITLDTEPTALPTTPLTGRKWIQFMNEDLVDIQLCDSAGVVFLTLEPGQKSEKYCAAATILFYGKVASGTADVGVRVIEGK